MRDRRIPLEVCPTSNVHTGAAASIADAPGRDCCATLRFRVTLNTDNRLMSDVTLSSEFAACAEVFGWTLDDVEWLTLNAMKSAFYPFDRRLDLINTRDQARATPPCARGLGHFTVTVGCPTATRRPPS